MNKKNVYYISTIAALYVALCLILAPISFGPIQLRLSEILCLLSIEYNWAIVALTIGCFISNLLFGGLGIIDVVFGTLATFLACLLANRFSKTLYKGKPILSSLMIVLCNAIIVGIEFGIIENNISIMFISMLEILISEAIIIFLVGMPRYNKLIKIVSEKIKK